MFATQHGLRRILVPLDGSARSEHALPYAQAMARPNTEVILYRGFPGTGRMHGVDGPHAGVIGENQRLRNHDALHELESVASDFRSIVMGSQVNVVMSNGDPAEAIVHTAAHLDVALIVMASEGRGSRGTHGLGSVADRVVRNARCPVLLVRDHALKMGAARVPIARIVVPLDGSERAAGALEIAKDLALLLNVQVLVLSVFDAAAVDLRSRSDALARDRGLSRDPSADAYLRAQCALDQGCARLLRHGIGVHSLLLTGPAAATIMDATAPGDVIVMTSRARGGGGQWPIGSVAEELTTTSPVPVVVVPTRRAPALVAPLQRSTQFSVPLDAA